MPVCVGTMTLCFWNVAIILSWHEKECAGENTKIKCLLIIQSFETGNNHMDKRLFIIIKVIELLCFAFRILTIINGIHESTKSLASIQL